MKYCVEVGDECYTLGYDVGFVRSVVDLSRAKLYLKGLGNL